MPPVNIVVIFLEHVLRKSPFSLPLLMSSIIHCTSDRERKTHRSSPSTLYNTVFNVLPILYIGEGREEKNAVKLVKFAIALFFLFFSSFEENRETLVTTSNLFLSSFCASEDADASSFKVRVFCSNN